MNKSKKYKDVFMKYETRCGFCGRKFITTKDTANEGICYECRCK